MKMKDTSYALRMRNIIRNIALEAIQEQRPEHRYGQVKSIDNANSLVTVLYPGEITAVPVKMGVIRPSTLDQIVRVEGTRTDRFVADVLGGGATSVIPGLVFMYGGSAAPSGYLLCNGASLVRADHPGLFAAIGTTHGAVDGTHFSLPNFNNAFPRGNTAASNGGTTSHTHTFNDGGHTHSTPNHAHSLSSAAWALIYITSNAVRGLKKDIVNFTAEGITGTSAGTGLTGAYGTPLDGVTDSGGASTTGSGTASGTTGSTNNLPPYVGVLFIIKDG